MSQHLETDWQAVAMFLAGHIVEESPGYAPLIIQLIADCTKLVPHTTTPAEPAERKAA
jgi:hypothetical protein